ncbi:CheY-like chemotaxis protein [Catenuloplanes nepalensis]|uniref:CheY-like chemotaxis protein n=1 Tax=Catenuloplanes nepalensis TaxID=587533 RepID=A0ABT9MYP3_9ACTN|nr:response regulator [Catenuloplanes nepalensis]MDP9796568.1 CheY-like chemotaxis protein [Catenuloplanes nepalensis]
MATIIAADDDPDLRAIVAAVLRRAGHVVSVEEDGAAALARVRRERPDVLIIDNQMPHMTGLEVRNTLRLDPETECLPIVLASGSLRAEELNNPPSPHDYLVPKPFQSRQLLETVETALATAALRAVRN